VGGVAGPGRPTPPGKDATVMHVFLSAGEPSGDLHAANLARSLRALRPDVRLSGFGGPRLREAGARQLYPLTDLAVMWFVQAIANYRTFRRLLDDADRHFATERPDAVVLVDYPGFHWHLAKRAKAHGIPVFYFVPPQLWAWAGWRVRKMKRSVDHVLCSLPFEEPWYRDRGVPGAEYVGHPYFDELREQRLDAEFVARHQEPATPLVTLLPGSRNLEVKRNFPDLWKAAGRVHAARPDTRFAVACFNDRHRAVVERHIAGSRVPAEVHVGRTPELIESATACLAVSGSVSLELMYRLKPAAVLYRMRWLDIHVGRFFMTTKYITLVNLLAGEELYPEYFTSRDKSEALAGHVLHWLDEPAARAGLVGKLAMLRNKVGLPGACDRAASAILRELGVVALAAQAA
jgi:lipid-A-disaccharide synthase